MDIVPDDGLIWLVVSAFIVAFFVAFGIGANDVANSFGTTVGAKVLGLVEAYILASIFELSGAVLIGSCVSDTVKEGIVDASSFNGTEKLVMAGAFSALSGTSCWLIAATFLGFPVSATHGIVGATMGYALVEYGTDGVHLGRMWMIAASWIISPVMSGAVSGLIFFVIKITILGKEDPFEAALKSISTFYGLTVAVNFFTILYRGSHLLWFNKIPLYGVLLASLIGGLIVAFLIHFAVRPWLRKRILQQVSGVDSSSPNTSRKNARYYWKVLKQKLKIQRLQTHEEPELCELSSRNGGISGEAAECSSNLPSTPCEALSENSAENPLNNNPGANEHEECIEGNDSQESSLFHVTSTHTNVVARDFSDSNLNDLKIGKLFGFLQIVMACFGAFAHGGNDVSNAIGPLMSVWSIYKTNAIVTHFQTPLWMLLFGGLGIVIGLCVWGRKVIETMGKGLTPITPLSGFTIEIGSALTVLIASNLGIPISTTHCKVGSIVSIGWVSSRKLVDWKLFGTIVLAWVVTVPCSGGMAAAVYAAVREMLY